VQLLHIVVHEPGIRKSAVPQAEPAGSGCNSASEHVREIARHAGVSRRDSGATRDNPGKPRYCLRMTTTRDHVPPQRGTHSSCPALMSLLVNVLAVMIS
jgi:hypothetical protein